MLHEIHIQNYAVIEKLALEFHAGLNLLSGETGSGKSILVDALGLALGGRATPDVVRTREDRATVTAVKYLPGRHERARELARMLSGSRITEAAMTDALAMLKQAGSDS